MCPDYSFISRIFDQRRFVIKEKFLVVVIVIYEPGPYVIYIDLLTHIITIEIDENQHRYYETTCQRLNNLFEDLIFMSFSLDGYVDKHGIKIMSYRYKN